MGEKLYDATDERTYYRKYFGYFGGCCDKYYIKAAIYKIVTNTKKYELTEAYRCELLGWYKSVVYTMVNIIHYCESGIFNSSDFKKGRAKLLSELSSLIEVGRFYFPNVIKKMVLDKTNRLLIKVIDKWF